MNVLWAWKYIEPSKDGVNQILNKYKCNPNNVNNANKVFIF
jgi:hypothetical protein